MTPSRRQQVRPKPPRGSHLCVCERFESKWSNALIELHSARGDGFRRRHHEERVPKKHKKKKPVEEALLKIGKMKAKLFR